MHFSVILLSVWVQSFHWHRSRVPVLRTNLEGHLLAEFVQSFPFGEPLLLIDSRCRRQIAAVDALRGSSAALPTN
jgi:hypothetical protein